MPADGTTLIVVVKDVTPERVVAADVKSADANKSATAGQAKDKVNEGCR